ncbi:MAG: single-stranded-DNA-specific exonuclease RecJ, partial [Oligoflexia bacterium]|nr:single-stranded-DNA-specific exonuclease RecJ [Oligoflexia bacterium]
MPQEASPGSRPLSVTGRRWKFRQNIRQDIAGDTPTADPLVAQVLKARAVGIDSSTWLHPSLRHLHDPYTMRGMATAVDRIRAAVRDKQRVRIVTDYDVDGTTSSLILQGTLRLLGGGENLDYHIPNRMGEGYGFSLSAADQAVTDQIDLLITADIGVRDHAAVQRAAQGGVDVIICDHHLPAGQSVPDAAVAVLCPPQADCLYENPALAACGVSLKLAQALLSAHPRREPILRSMLKIAAIGTVADVVDLSTLENRAIVSLGLQELRRGPHSPGLAALMGVSGISYDLTRGWHIDASDLGYRLGPRINAAGRLDSATAVIELFDERDPKRARERARRLDTLNTERKGIQRRLVQGALAQMGTTPPPFLVLWGPEAEGWHRGVVGIVAAKLREEIHRPVAVVAVSGDQARGSVRSIPEIHAVHALDNAADLLDQYGGHPVAAGFSLAADKLPALAERLAAWTEKQLGTDHPAPGLDIDAHAVPEQLTWPVVEALLGLGPF